MKNLFFYFRTLMVLVLLFISCDRKDDATSTATSSTAGFTWKEDSQSASEQKASSAYFQGSSIFALNASNATVFEINLMKSSAVGTYTFDGDYIKGTALVYVTKNFNATGGTITITEKTDSKVSGKFEATGTGNGITKVYGTFTGIPVK
ncbi:hypothetical protein [Epilithonimonas sp.]|uniref:hypothetical protein n=1 Tax=Epilithonimonas sp. TaxID=2894511 RepID=UPI0028A11B08|nr:hypothetical protein [Epilithonimonas sp.]